MSSEPSNGVPTHRKQNEGHVELRNLGPTLCDADTIAHDVVHIVALILDELPSEEGGTDREPQE